MHIEPEHADLQKFVTVQEAARILGVSEQNVHHHIQKEHLKATMVGGRYFILREDVLNFKPNMSGRPRGSVPRWRFSPQDNLLLQTTIEVDLRAEVDEATFLRALERVKRSETYLFDGTIARYVVSDQRTPRRVQFQFFWRQTVMPPEEEVTAMLLDLQAALAEVLDWEHALSSTGHVWMHT